MSARSTIENGCACGDREEATGNGTALPCGGGAKGCACGDSEQATGDGTAWSCGGGAEGDVAAAGPGEDPGGSGDAKVCGAVLVT
jgi:hypothetical protein